MTDFDAIIMVARLWLAQKFDDEIGFSRTDGQRAARAHGGKAHGREIFRRSQRRSKNHSTVPAACPAHWGLRGDDRRSVRPHKDLFWPSGTTIVGSLAVTAASRP